jgi:hypothetical protein
MIENDSKEAEHLDMQTVDYVATAAKAALGAVPFVGSVLAELAGIVIPNQRIDRIVKYATALETKICHLEQSTIREQLNDETFTDLMEEGLRQAARSLSDERREYIATLISNSLTSSDIKYLESKHLLKLLDELNDIEIIWLRYYIVSTINGDNEFRDNHSEIFKPVTRAIGTPQNIRDKGTIRDSYKDHLARQGLLEKDNKTYKITSLGRLLLREIGLIEKKQD